MDSRGGGRMPGGGGRPGGMGGSPDGGMGGRSGGSNILKQSGPLEFWATVKLAIPVNIKY